jgi:hypothetical protein
VPKANSYFGASVGFAAGKRWTVTARGGHENGFYDSKWDWEIGASYAAEPFTASLAYVGTDHAAGDEAGRLGKAGLVGSLLVEF